MDSEKSTLLERNTNPDNVQEENSKKGLVFAFILYPDDDRHMWVLRMLNRYPQIYRVVYILHDKDVWEKSDEEEDPQHVAGTLKKPHYHVLCVYKSKVTASSFSRKLGGVYCQLVSDRFAYILYMLHDTFESRDKFQYLPQDLKGDSRLIGSVLCRSNAYLQLVELCKHIDSEHGLESVISYVASNPSYQDTFEKYQYLIVAVNNDNRARSSRNALIDKYASACFLDEVFN